MRLITLPAVKGIEQHCSPGREPREPGLIMFPQQRDINFAGGGAVKYHKEVIAAHFEITFFAILINEVIHGDTGGGKVHGDGQPQVGAAGDAFAHQVTVVGFHMLVGGGGMQWYAEAGVDGYFFVVGHWYGIEGAGDDFSGSDFYLSQYFADGVVILVHFGDHFTDRVLAAGQQGVVQYGVGQLYSFAAVVPEEISEDVCAGGGGDGFNDLDGPFFVG